MKKNKIKKRFKNMGRRGPMFWVVVAVLVFVLFFLCIQNLVLREKVKELERQDEIRIGEGVNDFAGIVIEKVDTCLPVQLVSGNRTAIILGVQCLEKG